MTERKRCDAEPPQQVVDLLLAAEKQMIFVRLERPQARETGYSGVVGSIACP